MLIDTDKQKAVIFEIKSQLLQLDIKLKEVGLVSEYVELLVKKRELQELLNQVQNG